VFEFQRSCIHQPTTSVLQMITLHVRERLVTPHPQASASIRRRCIV